MIDLYNFQIGFRAAIYRLYRYSTPVGALRFFFVTLYTNQRDIGPLPSNYFDIPRLHIVVTTSISKFKMQVQLKLVSPPEEVVDDGLLDGHAGLEEHGEVADLVRKLVAQDGDRRGDAYLN